MMQAPAHIRRGQGACDLETFLQEACRKPCPVLLEGIHLWLLSYGGRLDTWLNWN